MTGYVDRTFAPEYVEHLVIAVADCTDDVLGPRHAVRKRVEENILVDSRPPEHRNGRESTVENREPPRFLDHVPIEGKGLEVVYAGRSCKLKLLSLKKHAIDASVNKPVLTLFRRQFARFKPMHRVA